MPDILPYIADSAEVSSTASLELDVVKTLGSVANVGWITCDDGDIYVQINDRGNIKIPLLSDEVILFKKEDLWTIKYLYITTDSATALTVRYFLRSFVVKIMEAKL